MPQAITLAQDQPAAPPGGQQQSQGGGLMGMLPLMAVMFAIIYFLLIRPQSKERKRHQEMLANIKKNDVVVTQGGIHGTVAAIDQEQAVLTVKIADNVRIKISRSAIARKIEAGGDE